MDNSSERMEMERVEEELRQCLRHVAAPDGFTARVMERVAVREAARPKVLRFAAVRGVHRHAGWWTALAAMLLLGLGGDMVHLHRVHEVQRETEAQQQVDLAMQLTTRALGQVGDGIERSHAARFTQMALELSK